MKREDIIRMAREVADIQTDSRGREEFIFDSYGIEAFANLVAAAEREACAYRAGIALLGADRGLAKRVDYGIRERGAP